MLSRVIKIDAQRYSFFQTKNRVYNDSVTYLFICYPLEDLTLTHVE
jgi:hypothetical protein